MNAGTDAMPSINRRIARRSERIARWQKEAEGIEPSWTGGPDYRRFCEAMERAACEKKAELEAELKRLQGYHPGIGWDTPVPLSDASHDLHGG